MPRDQNGIYSLPAGYKAVSGQKVLASQHNPPLEDLAASMTNSLPRTGVAPMTAALQMGGNAITGLADGSANTDAATFGQIGSALGTNTGAAPEKTTPVDDDYTPLYDSAASNVLRKLKWSSIKATLKTYFDTLYAPIGFIADLASTLTGKGASLVGVKTIAGISGATVQAVMEALAGQLLGVGQTWQDVSASRAINTSYRNTTGRAIQINVSVNKGTGSAATISAQVSTDNSNWISVGGYGGYTSGGGWTFSSVIIPDKIYYRVRDTSGASSITGWAELR